MSAGAAMRSGFVELGGLRIHHTYGGDGSPVLLVHGLGSSGYTEWRFNLSSIARRHRVLAPDLPGFGRSDKPSASYGVPYFARSLDAYLERLGVESAAVVGASLGGRVAIELALRHPARVTRLALVDSLGLGRPRLRPYYPLMAMPRLGEGLMRAVGEGVRRAPPALVRLIVARRLGSGVDTRRIVDESYLADLRELHGQAAFGRAYLSTVRSLARLRDLAGGRDLPSRLARLGTPVMLLWGEGDPIFPVWHARLAHAAIPGSQLAIIAGAGHAPQAERPEEFNSILENFLAGPS